MIFYLQSAPLSKTILLLAALFFTSATLRSQPPYTYSDSVKIFSWLHKAHDLAGVSAFDSAKHYARLALQLGKEKKMLRGQAHAHLSLADIAYRRSEETGTLFFHDSIALKIGNQLKDTLLLALAHHRLGQYYQEEEKYDEAQTFFQKALQLKFQEEQSSFTAVVYNDIGFNYGAKGQLDKQVEWYLKAVRIYEMKQDAIGLAQTSNNLAVTYNQLGKLKEALPYALEAIGIRTKLGDINGLAISCNNISQLYLRLDSLEQAVRYQQLGLQYAEKSGVKLRMANSYISMALLYNRQRKNKEALEYEKKAIVILQELNDLNALSRRYIAVGILSKATGDSSAALVYYQKAWELSAKLNNKENIRDIYYNRTIFYKDNKDFYNAYENYKKYILYRDSLISDKTRADIAEIETRYETEKKDHEIARLSTEQKIRQLEIEKQKATIAGNALLAQQKESEIKLLSQEKKLQEARIHQQEEDLERQLLIAKNSEQELKISRQEKLLQEKELQDQRLLRNSIIGGVLMLVLFAGILFNRYKLRKKLEQQAQLLNVRNVIARDLHDEIGSTLTSIKILSEVSQNNLAKDQQKAQALLQKITEQSSQMQQGMSDIVWTIRPDNDKLEIMLVRMREYAGHTLEPRNIQVAFKADESALSGSLDMQQRRDFFLVFKEAINNAAKYSQASKVEITVEEDKAGLKLLVSDNGIGFDATAVRSSNGLKNMKARALMLNGTLTIQSASRAGTSVCLWVPPT